jgi:predicted MFS family arabinose efflux permease
MTIDALPMPWNFVFQVVCVISITVILWQIKCADMLDHMRHPSEENGVLFAIRRSAKFVMALTLCWVVIYAHQRAWTVWPPIIIFLLAFDVHSITHILVMREDIKKRRQYESMQTLGRDRPARS